MKANYQKKQLTRKDKLILAKVINEYLAKHMIYDRCSETHVDCKKNNYKNTTIEGENK